MLIFFIRFHPYDKGEKQLDLITQPFEVNQENTVESEEEILEPKVDSDTEGTEEHPANIAVDDGVPDVLLID